MRGWLQQWLKVTRTEATAAFLLLIGALAGLILRHHRSPSPQWIVPYFDSVAAVRVTHGVGVTRSAEGVVELVRGDTLVREATLFPTSRRKKKLPTSKININTASFEELQRLPRIGPALARRIIAYRQRHPFRRIEEIVRVKGIGPKTFERLKPYITVGDAQQVSEPVEAPITETHPISEPQGTAPQAKVNINTATEEELIRLPGIGPVLARRIIEYRQMHPFQTIEEIQRVKGIGRKKFAKLKPFITVSGAK